MKLTLFITLLFSQTLYAQIKIHNLDKVLQRPNFPAFAIGIVKNHSTFLLKIQTNLSTLLHCGVPSMSVLNWTTKKNMFR
jgi:hypothetical protein